MKRKILLSIFIVMISVGVLIIYFPKEKKIKQNKEEINSSFISMMMENDEGKYVESTNLKFPITGYVFNAEKSGCENGGTLAWNKEKKKLKHHY